LDFRVYGPTEWPGIFTALHLGKVPGLGYSLHTNALLRAFFILSLGSIGDPSYFGAFMMPSLGRLLKRHQAEVVQQNGC